jgi:bifunctional non-homologous end joining protein LigD
VSARLAFVRPLTASSAVRPPSGKHWLHEPKWDSFRFQIVKNGSAIRFYSRHGADYTERLPGMHKAFAELAADAAIIDGELCLVDLRGAAHFWQLMSQMRSRWPDESRLMFCSWRSTCCTRTARTCGAKH